MTGAPSELRSEEQLILELPEDEAKSFEEVDESEPIPPNDIIAYNEVRSCADLFRLFSSGKMELQPDFQRDVVWKSNERARFIDSLVKQLPIPSMCFSLDPRTQRWKVIDGLQRMTSITDFLGPEEWRLAALQDIHPRLRGASNLALKEGTEEDSILYSAVENVTIPVTVIRCDYTKLEHMRYLFTIFHRLNSGGVRLNNQEIRNCIYTGSFNDALKAFDKNNADWLNVKSKIWGSVDRFRSVEILLRILAFNERLEIYEGNLADFLNKYMHDNVSLSGEKLEEKMGNLTKASRSARKILDTASTGKLSLAVIEAILISSIRNADYLETLNSQDLLDRLIAMFEMPAFIESPRYAVSSVENVRQRLDQAVEAFSS